VVCLASRLITVVICELRLYYVWPLAIESALRLSNEGSLFGSGEGKIGHKENTLNSLLEILCLLYRIGNLLYKSSLFRDCLANHFVILSPVGEESPLDSSRSLS